MKVFFVFLLVFFINPLDAFASDADKIIQDAINYWRGGSSYAEAEMTIRRPDWNRTTELNVWTKGTDKSLVRFTAPAKDAGNASLTLDNEIWSYTPKTNRVIKIPPSLKSKSWMGSDFSYDDLAKSDDITEFYDHTLIGEEIKEGKKIYVVESIPHESAPVVWGKEILKIREDNIIIEHDFYDQDGTLVKKLTAEEIGMLGGKLFATVIKMKNAEHEGEWTEIHHKKASFNLSIPESTFTLSALQNPRG